MDIFIKHRQEIRDQVISKFSGFCSDLYKSNNVNVREFKVNKREYMIKYIETKNEHDFIMDTMQCEIRCEYIVYPETTFDIILDYSMRHFHIYRKYNSELYKVDFKTIKYQNRQLLTDIARQIVEAVTNVHKLGYYHGSISPDDIYLYNFKVKIMVSKTVGKIGKFMTPYNNDYNWLYCTPIQCLNDKYNDSVVGDIDKIKHTIETKYPDIFEFNTIWSVQTWRENPIRRDLFTTALVLLQIYSKQNEHFWLPEYNNIREAGKIFANNIYKFSNDPEKYLDEFINRYIDDDVSQEHLSFIKLNITNIFKH